MESFETERNDWNLTAMIYFQTKRRCFCHLILLFASIASVSCARISCVAPATGTTSADIVLEPAFTVDSRQGSLHLFVHLQNNVGLLSARRHVMQGDALDIT